MLLRSRPAALARLPQPHDPATWVTSRPVSPQRRGVLPSREAGVGVRGQRREGAAPGASETLTGTLWRCAERVAARVCVWGGDPRGPQGQPQERCEQKCVHRAQHPGGSDQPGRRGLTEIPRRSPTPPERPRLRSRPSEPSRRTPVNPASKTHNWALKKIKQVPQQMRGLSNKTRHSLKQDDETQTLDT